jgi:hypothetical protein
MTSLHRAGRLATLLTIVAFLAGAQSALANHPDLRATTVPATSCQPATNADASRVSLSNGGWIFNSTSAGTITLYCPLPSNGNTMFDASNANNMTTIRFFYLDPDGMGVGSEIKAQLFFRQPLYAAVGAAWSSNSSNVTTATTAFFPLFHFLQFPALYSFEVRMSRATTDDKSPIFYGIDFP